jgi:hypothetical protein
MPTMASRWFVADAGDVDQPAKGERGVVEDSYKGDAKSVDQVKGSPGKVTDVSHGDSKSVEHKTKGDPKSAEPAPHLRRSKRRKALIAEPGWTWSKTPATVKAEWASRLGSGLDPKDAYRQLLAEINDHQRQGHIGNDDAHRAANEAFGRLLLSKRPRKGDTVAGHYFRCRHLAGRHDSPKSHEEVYQSWAHQHGQDPNDWGTFFTHMDPFDERPGLHSQEPGGWNPESDSHDPRQAQRKRGAGEVDQVIGSGYAKTPPQGKQVVRSGDRFLTFDEGPGPVGAQKSGRKHAWSGWGPSQSKQSKHPKVAGWNWDSHLAAYIADSGVDRFTCKCGKKFRTPDYHQCKCGNVYNAYIIGTGGDRHEAKAEKLLCRQIETSSDMIVANRKNALYAYDDLRFPSHSLEDEVEDITPFPSDHHPSPGKQTINKQPSDWTHRGPGSRFTPGHPAGPGAFKKKQP